ncbi:MAG: DUF433 domain-containing protein [Candidatus Sumerlaeota bacterium]|nr:DUF433 domain-containing protein [Candidatus Sumerlaeota bacterium]
MSKNQLLARISINPNICFGKPCIRGHRIWVSLILDCLAAGWTIPEVLENYPGLLEEDILACIAYGAEMSRERYIEVATEKAACYFRQTLDHSERSHQGIPRVY